MATGAAAPAILVTVEAKNPSAPVSAVVASQRSSSSVAAPVTNPLSGPSDSENVAAARAAIQPPTKKATRRLNPPQIPAAVPQVWGSSPPRALMPRASPRTDKNKRTANAVTTPAIIGPHRIRSRIGTSATSTSTAGTPITPVAAVEGGKPVESILPVADDSAVRFPRGSVLIHRPPTCQLHRPRRTAL